MGFHFRVQHTNLVAFVTTPAAEAPRASKDDLYEFVGAFAMQDPTAFLVSGDRSWLNTINDTAREVLRHIDAMRDSDPSAEQVAALLQGIRAELTGYSLYGLVVPPVGSYQEYTSWRRSSPTVATAEHLAFASGGDALFLFPNFADEAPDLSRLDALPAGLALESAARRGEPGIVLWTARGTAAFVPEHTVVSVAGRLLAALRAGATTEIDRLLEASSPRRQRRVLHLSDLHFGSSAAAQNLAMLEAELHDVVGAVDRIAITGDLFDNPNPQSAASFRAFRLGLERVSHERPIVVPGNHDQRILGNIGQSFEQISQIPWAPVIIDENMETVFVALNSSIRGSFARGRVTLAQLSAVGAELRNALAMQPRAREFLRVALIHHHPFAFETDARTFVQRLLGVVGLSDEAFLRMEDATEFLSWCARWGVSVVLHGHKHIARFVTEIITPEAAPRRPVTAIGCGTSLGAEGLPLSYNIVYWDDRELRWGARFFESQNGGPFLPKLISTARRVEPIGAE